MEVQWSQWSNWWLGKSSGKFDVLLGLQRFSKHAIPVQRKDDGEIPKQKSLEESAVMCCRCRHNAPWGVSQFSPCRDVSLSSSDLLRQVSAFGRLTKHRGMVRVAAAAPLEQKGCWGLRIEDISDERLDGCRSQLIIKRIVWLPACWSMTHQILPRLLRSYFQGTASARSLVCLGIGEQLSASDHVEIPTLPSAVSHLWALVPAIASMMSVLSPALALNLEKTHPLWGKKHIHNSRWAKFLLV